MFGQWSPTYEEDVAQNHYSAADKVSEAAIKHLSPVAAENPLIADAGIGTGLLAQQIFDAMPCRIAGLDFSEDMLSVCLQREITELLIKCDIGKDHWPLEDGAYHGVISAGVLEYLTPDMVQHFLKESARIMKSGAILVFTYVPTERPQQEIGFWQGKSGNFLSCRYNPLWLKEQVAAHGLNVIEHSEEFTGSVFRDNSTYPYRLIVAYKN